MCADDKEMNIGPSEWKYIKEQLIQPYMNSLQEYSKHTREDIRELRADFKSHINRDNTQEKKLAELSSVIKRSLIPALNRVTKFVKDCRGGESARINKAVGAIKKTPVWQTLILYLAVISGITGGVVVTVKEIYGLEQMRTSAAAQAEQIKVLEATVQAIPKEPSQ